MTKEDAAVMTKAWRDNGCMPTQKSTVFGNDALDAIRAQSECAGIIFYSGLDINGVFHLIAVGIKEDGTIMIDGLVMERSRCCIPNYCNIGCGHNILNPN